MRNSLSGRPPVIGGVGEFVALHVRLPPRGFRNRVVKGPNWWHQFRFARDPSAIRAALTIQSSLVFILIKAMGSEQAGLTGVKGSMVRKVAIGRRSSSLEKSLAAIKNMLEAQQPCSPKSQSCGPHHCGVVFTLIQ